jgi:hypothetical protein
MTIKEQEVMISSQKLLLNRKRKLLHYEVTIAGAALLTFSALVCLYRYYNHLYIQPGMDKFNLGLLVLTAFSYWYQNNKLWLRGYETLLPKADNYRIVKKALKQLQWPIKIDNQGFLEAKNSSQDIRTWGDEMISIVITDRKILVNSICNLDGHKLQIFSFGKNKENTDKLTAKVEEILINEGYARNTTQADQHAASLQT